MQCRPDEPYGELILAIQTAIACLTIIINTQRKRGAWIMTLEHWIYVRTPDSVDHNLNALNQKKCLVDLSLEGLLIQPRQLSADKIGSQNPANFSTSTLCAAVTPTPQ